MFTFEDIFSDDFVAVDQQVTVGDYLLYDVIGKGKSSIVRLGVRQRDKQTFAVKIIPKRAGSSGHLLEQQYNQEVVTLRQLRHDHIVTLCDCLQSRRNYYIVLELLPGEKLSQYVSRRKGLSEDEACHLSHQLVETINYIHSNQVVLRDLKPDNVIIDPCKKKLTLIDFGLSTVLKADALLTQTCGTPVYEAPEISTGKGYDQAVDMWSLGVTIVQMLMGSVPHIPVSLDTNSFVKLAQKREILDNLPNLSEDGLHFLSGLLEINPQKRMTAHAAHLHAWLQP